MMQGFQYALTSDKAPLLCISPYLPSQKSDFTVLKANHPIPKAESFVAAKTLVDFLSRLPQTQPVIFGISGGASASVAYPKKGLSRNQITVLNRWLMSSGLPIGEMNLLRKACSSIKGGKLLGFTTPSYYSALISDVPGNVPEWIGSGLTVPERIEREQLETALQSCSELPSHIKSLFKGFTGHDTSDFPNNNEVVLSADMLAQNVRQSLIEQGFRTPKPKSYDGDIKTVVDMMVETVWAKDRGEGKCAFVFFGESTVNVLPGGKGGRNQELALRFGRLAERRQKQATILSLGTDGIDGPTDAAGALLRVADIRQAREKGIDIDDFIARNDSYHCLEKMKKLIKIGPTGSNLMDIQIVTVPA